MIAFSSQLQKDYVPRWYIVIFRMNAFNTTAEEAKRLAEVIGVIGHGIGGKYIPIMAHLAKGKTLE